MAKLMKRVDSYPIERWFSSAHCKTLRMLVFLAGLVMVLVFALQNPEIIPTWKALVLFALGVLIGILDVPRAEQNSFLLAALGIIVTSSVPFQLIDYYRIGLYIKAILLNLSLLLTPAVISVGLTILVRLFRESRE